MLPAHHFEQFKLPAVLREYEKVARECARDGIGRPRYRLKHSTDWRSARRAEQNQATVSTDPDTGELPPP